MPRIRIDLKPLGRTLYVDQGAPLRDVLHGYGVEFPCGGRGRCRSCRVRVLEGALPPTAEQVEILSPRLVSDGWRLACRCHADRDVTLEIAQWEAPVLADSTPFEFTPREGLGVAVDLGTTTIAAQLLDLQTGRVLAVQTGLNPQAAHGADIMSRVEFAATQEGAASLRTLIRAEIFGLIGRLAAGAGLTEESPLRDVVIVGNTVMHHLFCGIDVAPLSHYPFEPVRDGLEIFEPAEIGWQLHGNPPIRFLPCLGGFVGSDILAGVMAIRMEESEAPVALVDLGTNGEVVVGNRERILCASTAAGPAFEGARIRMGMQAATGAISEVAVVEAKPVCRVLGGGRARGICGSGLVDAVAAGLNLGIVRSDGRFAEGGEWLLCDPVSLIQSDVRELQLAKGAIAAAVRILLSDWGIPPHGVGRVFLAGAFGNYVNRDSARRIGLIEFPEEKVSPAGNTALLGAKLALFRPAEDFRSSRARIRHVPLAADSCFQEVFVESMSFPPACAPGA